MASVGLLLDQAKERGIDAAEYTVDIGTSAKGYTTETEGHCTIVVDRTERVLVGAFLAGPAVSEVLHECVLAIRAGSRWRPWPTRSTPFPPSPASSARPSSTPTATWQRNA